MASTLAPIVSIWVSADRRRLVEVIPGPVRHIWDKWDLRGSILVSLLCQTTLTFLGSRRKSSASKVINSLVWATYLMSDWVINFALGIISSKLGDPIGHRGDDEDDPVLIAFWATLLLEHFGGPATITAEALEDNALWPRNMALWIVQSVRVLYLVLLAWTNTWLSYLSLATLVLGFVKCGEKTLALYSASITHNRDKFVKEFNDSAKDEDLLQALPKLESGQSANILDMNPRVLFRNFILFFVSLFVDLVLSYDYLQKHQSIFRRLKPELAFELVEVQLGYAYDVFYTKTSVLYNTWNHMGWFSFYLGLGSIICFGTIVDKKHHLSKMDRSITWTLLIGTFVLDCYATNEISLSDWFGKRLLRYSLPHLLPRHPNLQVFRNMATKFYTKIPKRRWSNVIAKRNLLTLCLHHKYNNIDVSGEFNKLLELLETKPGEGADESLNYLKKYIFDYLVNKSQSLMNGHSSIKYGANDAIDSRGPKSIERTKRLEFHQSILTWHIATDMCYYGIDDIQKQDPMAEFKEVSISRNLSDYMLYILVKQRQMLPVGTGLISFRDTCVETMEFLQQLEIKTPSENLKEACQKLLQVDPDSEKRSQPKSVLRDACRLARTLTNEMETRKRWELLAAVWVEILGYAATHCRADQHAQQLRKGGEFLTHVWLLSAHLGVMEQFQVTTTQADPSEEQSMDQTNIESGNGNTNDNREPEHRIDEREIEEEPGP